MKIRDDILNFIKPKTTEIKSANNGLDAKEPAATDSFGKMKNMTETENILTENNVEFSDDDIEAIDKFLSEGEGTKEEKIEAIKIADSKNIDFTFENLDNINQALRETVDMKKIMTLIEAIKTDMAKFPESIKNEIIKFIQYAEANPIISEAVGNELLVVLEGILAVESSTEGIAEEFVEKVLSLMAEKGVLLSNELEDLDADTDKYDNTVEKNSVIDYYNEDYYGIIKEYIEKALEDIESIENEMVISSDVFKFENLKMYIVKETTAKTIELKNEFEKYRSEILDKLEPLEKLDFENIANKDKETAKFVINSTIDKIDKLIMKSDITLFTDMKTEKNLLSYSSDLADAKGLVEKGKFSKAMEVVKKVVKGIKEIKFEPSFTKIQAFEISKLGKTFNFDKSLENQHLEKILNFSESENTASARKVLELFRSMGLNHEYELTEKIGNLKEFKNHLKLEPNIKDILMKLSEYEKEDKNIVETIEKSLNNLNGQQLMNKQGNKGSGETMFFNIPIYTENEFKNMKLYINSREKNNKLDWENCDLYFVINFKEYGETGIKVDIKNRNLKITIKNDNEKLKGKMTPLLASIEENFSGVGFNIGDILFKSMNVIEKSLASDSNKDIYDKMDEKGFDFKI